VSYASNFIAFLNRKRRDGIDIDVVPSDASGQVDVVELERRIDGRTRLIALTHVPTNGGLVNPAENVGRIARAHGVPFLLDACQSAGQMPLDVGELGCDMLSAAGRKYLRGPRGTGFLFVREDFMESLDPPTPDVHAAEWTTPDAYRLRSDARRFELWESNKAAQVGLGIAADYAMQWGLETIWQRIRHLADDLRSRMADVPGATVRDTGRTKCGIVTFDIVGHEAIKLKRQLREMAINVSVTVPSTTLLDARARSLPDLLRASVHYFNTEEEIERFVGAITQIVS
jgi:selenocysteine lyase/cysteine desulfurase